MMTIAYRYVMLCCGVCKNNASCPGWRRIEKNEAIDYWTLKAMADCPDWKPEIQKKEGDK